ncbi:hypothetical protein [Aureimonas populi]|uniref:Uncharacterized protein n=1 Tax=Aureimonas populi TaxID=1701758 RepID=A0ABW5CJX8_9HYPH|nr:hypothetical protein [Aureimonas populi]
MSEVLEREPARAGDIASADALRDEIVDRLRLHTEMVSRLLDEPAFLPEDFAVFLEDVANAYLDIAAEVNARSMPLGGRPH